MPARRLDEIFDLPDKLRQIRETITPSSRWTRGALARDRRGREVFPHSQYAVRWSISGAFLTMIADEDLDAIVVPADVDLRLARLEGANDRLGHAHILAELDRWVEELESQAPDRSST